MSTTTMGDFWTGFQTSTIEMFGSNWQFFALIFGTFIAIFTLVGIGFALTYIFRKRRRF